MLGCFCFCQYWEYYLTVVGSLVYSLAKLYTVKLHFIVGNFHYSVIKVANLERNLRGKEGKSCPFVNQATSGS